MIRHDHIAFKRQRRIGRRNIFYCLIDHFSVGRQFNVLRAINDRPYIFPKIILPFQRTYCNKICTAGTIVIIFQTISFSLGQFFFIIHLHHLYHYNTNRQRKQCLCRFVLPNSPLRTTERTRSVFSFYFNVSRYFLSAAMVSSLIWCSILQASASARASSTPRRINRDLSSVCRS